MSGHPSHGKPGWRRDVIGQRHHFEIEGYDGVDDSSGFRSRGRGGRKGYGRTRSRGYGEYDTRNRGSSSIRGGQQRSYHSKRPERRSATTTLMADTVATSVPDSVILCQFWANNGDCRKYPECRYRHDLRLICQIRDAHEKGIYSMCSVTVEPSEEERLQYALQPGTTLVDLYTASQDKTVKRWTLIPDTSAETKGTRRFARTSNVKLQIRHVATFELGASCLSIFYGQGCLICGLSNGDIKVFDRSTGQEITLKGHRSEIHAIQFIDSVLLSGDWKGQLLLWKPDPVQKNFVIGGSLDIGSPITCFIEVSTGSFSDASRPPTRHLWVGCTGGIKIVDLLTLSLITTIEIPAHRNSNTPPVVMSLLRLEDHILCCLLGGGVKVFNASTAEEITLNGTRQKHFCSMTGSQSQDGPVVLCGAPQGRVHVLNLPTLDEKLHFKYHERDVRAIHNIGGTPSFFATAAMDGSLNIWYWSKPSD